MVKSKRRISDLMETVDRLTYQAEAVARLKGGAGRSFDAGALTCVGAGSDCDAGRPRV